MSEHHTSVPALLTVVGLGPGDAALCTPQALAALEAAELLVGYTRYIGLIPDELRARKRVMSTGMRGEMQRCQHAIQAALEGTPTAVVSSGDAGVYGMAGLVLELLEEQGLLDRVPVEIVPGVPALAAAAALLGAPLMHDFAVISLSDLLTPWEVIERRLEHAAAGDFVIVLYNPRSTHRDWQLGRALERIAACTGPTRPAGLVRQAYRPDQAVMVSTLGEMPWEQADMLSIVVVGNSQTRIAGGRLLTPRGYMDKYRVGESSQRR
ncbi:precorrin-3B C(17)-methyltransferase [Megalodesulfovibrio gigas]|uniref:Putative precorrin-3b C17-methyltransferase n=1 Tax=Megalodesulfovibrio gigas (strain ATCC 19364 / DSM 1382 / NCIMB 9332 / VKM B-1759) TaxID=1121448 RepID=T2GBF7_MEGG1|nr:precorrin-3B C(17)-methyltransferase [Megalodesulfovibrio gigas]AGW13242.1 putative precorrin-3b C17-methyltransferase [Megalodesulfovibrio gigas DSM 1382 = ATCC 19364]